MEQVEFLQFVPSLQELTLRGNPVCDASDTFREGVFALLTSLELLDDEPKEGFEHLSPLAHMYKEKHLDGPVDCLVFWECVHLISNQRACKPKGFHKHFKSGRAGRI